MMDFSRLFKQIGTRLTVGTVCLTMSFPIQAMAETQVQYQTVKGDTLSDIVWALVPGRLYGKNGNLRKVERLNSSIRNPQHLTTGTVILLPDGSRYVIEQINQFGPDRVKENFKVEKEVLARMRFLSDVSLQAPSIAESKEPEIVKNRKPASQETEVIPVAKPVATQITVAAPKSADSPPADLEKKKEPPPPVSEEKSESPRLGYLAFSPTYRMMGISLTDPSTGLRANLATKYYLSSEVLYFQKVSESFQTFIGANFGYVSFASPEGSTKSITNSSHFLTGIKLGASGKIARDLTFTGILQYNNELFGRASSTTTVTVDAVPVPAVGGILTWDALHFNPFIYGLSGFFTEYFSAQSGVNYTVRHGQGYGGSIFIKQLSDNKTPPFETQAGFLSRAQNTSSINQTETTYFLTIRFYIPFLNKEEERMK
jgi:hypothetical protein